MKRAIPTLIILILLTILILLVANLWFWWSRFSEPYFSNLIQLAMLAVVVAYTYFTYALFQKQDALIRQQQEHFLTLNRPIVYLVDVSYDDARSELGFHFLNTGKLPARLKVMFPEIKITPLFGEKPSWVGKFPPEAEVQAFLIYPHIETDQRPRYMPKMILNNAEEYIHKGCKLEMKVEAEYWADGNPNRYSFLCIADVPSLDLEQGIQTCNVHSSDEQIQAKSC